jgi:nicotinamidase-related amidase
MADRRETFERVLAPEPGRTALVVVDMQRGFLDPGEAMEVPPAREIVPVIQDEMVVRKRGYDAFSGTLLDGALRARNVTSLVVTGTMTDICVLATVTAALHRQYRVTLVEDGVATLWPEIQRAALDIIGRAYGRVVTAKEVIDQISGW